MRVLSIVHEREAGGGVFADASAPCGHELVEWMPAEAGAPGRDGFGVAFVFGGAMHVDQDQRYGWLRAEKELPHAFLERGTPALPR